MSGKDYKAARKAAKLSLDAASDKIGLSKTYLWQFEHDKAMPSAEQVAKMAKAYGVELSLPDTAPSGVPDVSSVSPRMLELISAAKAVVSLSLETQLGELMPLGSAVLQLANALRRASDELPPSVFQQIKTSSDAIVRKALQTEQTVSRLPERQGVAKP